MFHFTSLGLQVFSFCPWTKVSWNLHIKVTIVLLEPSFIVVFFIVKHAVRGRWGRCICIRIIPFHSFEMVTFPLFYDCFVVHVPPSSGLPRIVPFIGL